MLKKNYKLKFNLLCHLNDLRISKTFTVTLHIHNQQKIKMKNMHNYKHVL